MNLVRDLHYFIYLEFSLLILFLKVDADHRSTDNFKDVMELIRPTNAENNEANRIEPEFTLFCEKNAENVVEMLNLAWNFVRRSYTLIFLFFFFSCTECILFNSSAETISSQSKKDLFSFVM